MRLRTITLCLVPLLAALSCAKKDGRPHFAFVTNLAAEFWSAARKGVEDAATQYDVQVDFRMPRDATDQKNIVEDMLVRGVDGIAISPRDPANQTDFLNQVADQTTLICHDSDAPSSKRLCFVGVDNYKAGRLCGELVKTALPDGGTIVAYVAGLEQDNARRRRQGLIDELLGRSYDADRFDAPGTELAGNGYRFLDTLTDGNDPSKAKGNVEDTLSLHPDIQCMVGLFAYNPPIILEVLRQAGKLGAVRVVAFDEDDATLQGIKDGHVTGTVVQDPYRYGTESIRILTALQRGDRSVLPESGFLEVPARKISGGDVDAFWSDLRKKTGKGGA